MTQIQADWFEGRDQEIEVWIQHAAESPIVWLRGESGSGKSTLLRLGVAPRLAQGHQFLPICVNLWGEDWMAGPFDAIGRELAVQIGRKQEVSSVNLEGELSAVQANTGRRPLLIFDQFDDYQSMHHDRFLKANSATITPVELVASNRFWKMIAGLLERAIVHCIFVTRSDSPYGLECVRLLPSVRDTYLGRLPPATVWRVLERLVPPGAVERPEAGWNDFAGRLCRDLERDGALPVQMMLAFRALQQFRQTPIRSDFYRKVGELPGLESNLIEHHMREASRAASWY